MIYIDFETYPIEPRPNFPPRPVGCAILADGCAPCYLSWAHLNGYNNSTFAHVLDYFQRIKGKYEICAKNAKFEYEILQVYFGITLEQIHDVEYLLFLANPDSKDFNLEIMANEWLGIPPTEQEKLKEWILNNIPQAKPKNWGAYIAYAPTQLVADYSIAQIIKTKALFEYLYPQIEREGMLPAYDRERALMPWLVENEQQGLRIDVQRLERDVERYQGAYTYAENWLYRRFGRELNLDAGAELVSALRDNKIVTQFAKTKKTKKDSTAKDTLTKDLFNDQKVFAVLNYRNKLKTCLNTFMQKWLQMASSNNKIFTTWNQTLSSKQGGDLYGARTGRITSDSPPFTNIPKTFETKYDYNFIQEQFGDSFPELPLIRRYVLPDEGTTFIHRDYDQQEMRILAHFENGRLKNAYNEAYKKSIKFDVHQYVTDVINSVLPFKITRYDGKQIDLGMVYGLGKGHLARRLGCTVEAATAILKAQRAALPDIASLQKRIKIASYTGQPVVTWGGRHYYCEPPKIVEGSYRRMDYKQLNRLIQPSAADCTKESLLRYFNHPKRQGRFLITVYDEINVCAENWKEESEVLRECMESVEFNVPMLTTEKHGENWGELIE